MASQSSSADVKFHATRGIVCCVTSIELQLTIKRLRKQLAERDAIIADRDAHIARIAADVAKLQAAVKHLLAQRGGGHHIPEGQGVLFPELANAAAAPTADDPPMEDQEDGGDGEDEDDSPAPPRGKQGRKRTPRRIDTTGLRREEQRHDVPSEERIDPVTGKPLPQVGESVSEELDYRRGELVVIVHRQPIYGLPPDEAEHRRMQPVTAELPPRPLENCAASARLLAWLFVQKYGNHLPLYRQETIFARDGMRIPRQTQCDWVLASAELLVPIVDCLMTKIRAGPVMQLDDTPVMCQGGRGESHFQACLWTFVNPEVGGVAYRFTSGRASGLLATEIGCFQGWLVGDGYSGNRAAANKAAAANEASSSIHLCGCWAHLNRKLRDAEREAPAAAKLFRKDIQRLYAIEREADAAALDPDARKALRQRRSKPILVEIFARAWQLGGKYSDAGLMAKAIGYLRNQHRALRRFLEDGRIPLDNNACERAIRPIAIGRRNWLFAGSMRGGRAAAVAYSLIECCRLADVDPIDYLADVLVRVGSHPASRVEEPLPANWVKRFAPVAENEPALA